MKLYIAVAALTFAGSFAGYSALQMSGAAGAIGGRSDSTTNYVRLFKDYNPLTLLQPDRVRALATSSAGIPGLESYRSKFSFSGFDAARALRPPAIDTGPGRRAWGASLSQQFKPPLAYTTPPIRTYR
jgi:hypothetical protein